MDGLYWEAFSSLPVLYLLYRLLYGAFTFALKRK